MLRFIDLKGQITEDESDFAWFDTVTDKFVEVNGCETWKTWTDFVDDYERDDHYNFPLDRFSALFPVMAQTHAREERRT